MSRSNSSSFVSSLYSFPTRSGLITIIYITDPSIAMYQKTMIIVLSMMLLWVLPGTHANPMPSSVWDNAQAGGSPKPSAENANITFFKEIVKADIGRSTVKVHADYWFRNVGTKNETIKILLPLSKDPEDIDLKADGYQTGWYRIHFSYHTENEYYNYVAILFEIFMPPSQETKVTIEFTDELSVYDTHLNDYKVYFYSYLVGSAREWNRPLESASFEFKVPVSMYDRGENEGWERDREGSDYVFTKEFSDWVPEEDFEFLKWEEDRLSAGNIIANHPIQAAVGAVLILIIVVMVVLAIIMMIRSRKSKSIIKKGN